jgi:hypothetical protein
MTGVPGAQCARTRCHRLVSELVRSLSSRGVTTSLVQPAGAATDHSGSETIRVGRTKAWRAAGGNAEWTPEWMPQMAC